MDYEVSIKPGDPATNTLMAEMVTRLTEAEEAHWRGLLAAAWDEGARHRNVALGFEDNGSCFRHCNPYREGYQGPGHV